MVQNHHTETTLFMNRIVSFSSDYICRDWSVIYDAAEVNHKAYQNRRNV